MSWPTGSSLWQTIAIKAYWKSEQDILEAFLEVLVVDAQYLESVPGGKIDRKDGEWLGDMLGHGFSLGTRFRPL